MGFEFLEEDKDIKGKSKAKKQHTRNGIQLLLLFFLFVCLFVCLAILGLPLSFVDIILN
jgi:hypothetical protein